MNKTPTKSGYTIGTLASAFTHEKLALKRQMEELSELAGLEIDVVRRFARAPVGVRRQALTDIRQGLLESMKDDGESYRTTSGDHHRRDHN